MVLSNAKTVEQYLSELPTERRNAIAAVRNVILTNLPKGYEETMQYGMISYVIPLERYPKTYNSQALALASLASQKNYMSIYLMNVYGNEDIEKWFHDKYIASGKKLDMGMSCVRFRKLENLPLDLIGETIAMTSVDEFIRRYEETKKIKVT